MKISVTKDLGPLKLEAEAEIIRRAAAWRAQYATPSKDGIYSAKLKEAERWFAEGEPEDLSTYPYMVEEVGVTTPDAYQLASLWINLNVLWVHTIAPQIEGAEMRAKKAATLATTPAGITAAISQIGANQD